MGGAILDDRLPVEYLSGVVAEGVGLLDEVVGDIFWTVEVEFEDFLAGVVEDVGLAVLLAAEGIVLVFLPGGITDHAGNEYKYT